MSERTAPGIGPSWGDNISTKRQRELDGYLAAWNAPGAERMGRNSPFDQYGGEYLDVTLSGADVFYLAACAAVGTTVEYPSFAVVDEERALDSPEEVVEVFTGYQEEYTITDIDAARRQLRDPVGRTFVDLSALNLYGARLIGAHLVDAYLVGASLDRANLTSASLENANLSEARLTRADLRNASLEGADFESATLMGADLGGARLDRDTRLNDAMLTGVSLDQSALDRANLTVLSWEGVAPLGEEVTAHSAKDALGERKSRATRIEEYEAAVRANRLLATSLRTQGLADDGDVFAHRTQILQRKLHFRRRRFGRWGASWFLAALSGYGYRLANIFVAYGLALGMFSLIFWALGVRSFDAAPPHQALWDSFLVSLAAIHGRALLEQLGAWSPAAWVAAIESVVGIVIEGVFVAMLIQRLFR